MNKRELIESLEEFNDDDMVILKDSRGGWCNIDYISKEDGSCAIDIMMEEYPVFSEG